MEAKHSKRTTAKLRVLGLVLCFTMLLGMLATSCNKGAPEATEGGSDAAQENADPKVISVLRLKEDVEAGTKITSSKFETVELDPSKVWIGAITDPEAVMGKYAQRNMTAGDFLLEKDVGEDKPVIKKALAFLFGKEPLTVGPGVKTGLGIRCDIPSSVGGDLICASLAAHKLYGSPSLIVDIDTATKMTLVNSDGAFVGTSILPGVLMGLDALSSSAALLPTVELSAPSRVIGKNTADCMRSGILYGNASMIDGMIDRIFAENGEMQVILTGSQAHLVTPYLEHSFTLDEHLVLRGLKMIFDKNN